MKKSKRIKFFVAQFAIITLFVILSIGSGTEQNAVSNLNMIFQGDIVLTRNPQNKYNDLKNGLEVHIVTTQANNESTRRLYHLSNSGCFSSPTNQYIRSMGFSEMSPNTDYHLYITINKADVINSFEAEVSINVSLKNEKNIDVFTQNNIGKHVNYEKKYFKSSKRTGAKYAETIVMDEAYTQALEQINWNRIASFLKNEPKIESTPIVQGLGNTDLEQTIIRWDIQSRPQGADIFWRVVSKTPEVKSTNNKYLQTTPYEATKAVDIKGLTPENATNVRIVLRCEKDGYLPQEKEYNVRMIIDQEEISAFFKLVKENE